jgi:hypothetical protein
LKPLDVTPRFKLVFFSVLGLTVLSLVVSFVLVTRDGNSSEDTRRLIETCSTAFKMGFGAVVGLLGGSLFSIGAFPSSV